MPSNLFSDKTNTTSLITGWLLDKQFPSSWWQTSSNINHPHIERERGDLASCCHQEREPWHARLTSSFQYNTLTSHCHDHWDGVKSEGKLCQHLTKLSQNYNSDNPAQHPMTVIKIQTRIFSFVFPLNNQSNVTFLREYERHFFFATFLAESELIRGLFHHHPTFSHSILQQIQHSFGGRCLPV